MKKITPIIFALILPLIGFSAADSVSMGPGYTNQVFYNFADGAKHTSDNTGWDLAFGIGGFNTDIRINDGWGAELYVYPNGDTAAWNNIDTNGMQNWTPRFNSDTSWNVTAFAGPEVEHPDYGWGIYNNITHVVEGDSIYIIKLTDGSYKKLRMDVMATNGDFTFSYADIDGSNEVNALINKPTYSTKKHVYYSCTSDAILDLEPAQKDWDIVFTKYNQAQPQGGFYKVTGVLVNSDRTVAEARGVDLTTVGWYGHDYTSNIGQIGSDWKAFNMVTFSYDIVDSLTYFIADTNQVVWQLTFTGFDGSSTGDIFFNKTQVGHLSVNDATNPIQNVAVFPNPAVDQVTVSFENTQNNAEITVYSLTGQVVYASNVTSTQVNIPVSQWQKGMYLVRIGNTKNATVKQLIVK